MLTMHPRRRIVPDLAALRRSAVGSDGETVMFQGEKASGPAKKHGALPHPRGLKPFSAKQCIYDPMAKILYA